MVLAPGRPSTVVVGGRLVPQTGHQGHALASNTAPAPAQAALLCGGLTAGAAVALQVRRRTGSESSRRRRSLATCCAGGASSGWEKVDATYNPDWLSIEERSFGDLQWRHPQTVWAGAACALWAFEVYRFLHLMPPSGLEVCVAGLVYAGLYASRYQEVERLPKHYRVTFYASCGWAFYSFASLVHVMAGSSSGAGPAEAFHAAGCAVFLGSCLFFYAYHWGRMWRHWCEDRFRPWFAFGIAGLTAVHLLSVGHIFKVLDDPRWWPTVAAIYPDEWHFVADIRLAELFLTAAALFLVICHLRGVLTGTKNAAVVFAGTVFLPAAALVFESWFLQASAWQHYLMNGPKYW